MNRGLDNFKTFNLAKAAYRASLETKLPYHLKDQLLRSISSIAINLAEGSGKRTRKDQRRYYEIAMGSLRESQAILSLHDIENSKLNQLLDQTGASLYRLLQTYGYL